MSKPLKPHKIIDEVKKGIISKSHATEILISLIEGSDDYKIRAESIIGLDQIEFKTEQIFKIIENILISDNNPLVRNAAAQVITHHYVKEGLNSLKYVITHDKSPIVMKTIFEFLSHFNEKPLSFLNEELKKWMEKFAIEIGIAHEEAKFFLDLEALFAANNENYEIDTSIYKYFKIITEFKSGRPWLSLKNEHVEILNFNYFKWKFLKDSKDHIESYLNLSSPDLFLSSIHELNFSNHNSLKIPKSIGLLKHIKILNLERNRISLIPESIRSLSSIEVLDLSHNNISKISDSICSLSSLQKLNLSHNKIKELPSAIENLKLLNELKIHKNKISTVPNSLIPFFNSLVTYKI